MKHVFSLVVFLAAVVSQFAFGLEHKLVFSAQQTAAIEKIIDEHLVNHPEVLIKMVTALKAKQAEAQRLASEQAIKSQIDPLFHAKHSPVIGPQDAAVTVVEFFDYQCGHCKAMAAIVSDVLKENKSVRFIFKELPIFGADSNTAAKVALAASKQKAYLPVHDALFKQSAGFSPKAMAKLMKAQGLNVGKMKATLKEKWIEEELKSNSDIAQALKIEGTPAFIIANKDLTQFEFIPGAISKEDLLKKIQAIHT
jgi:protein-disulfide isomerase